MILEPTRIRRRLGYRTLRLRRSIAKASLLALGRPAPVRFLLLCRPRTGSNHLLSLLEQHGQVLVYGEKLRTGEARAAHQFLDRLHARRAFWIRAVGFKAFYDHLEDPGNAGALRTLCEDHELRIIHLTRRNFLHTLLSEHLAVQTDRWIVRSDQSGPGRDEGPIELPAEWLEAQFFRIRDQQQRFGSLFSGHQRFDLEFEDLIAGREQVFAAVCDFLAQDPRPARSYTLRQRHRRAEEIIGNYAELARYFAGSEWAGFFRKDPDQ